MIEHMGEESIAMMREIIGLFVAGSAAVVIVIIAAYLLYDRYVARPKMAKSKEQEQRENKE
jgi:hypothetical protein